MRTDIYRGLPGKRKRGRPKTRWKDACQRDFISRAYWGESRRGDRHGDVEKDDLRPYMMAKVRDKKKIINVYGYNVILERVFHPM